MKFVDLAAQQNKIRANLEKRLFAVLDHGQYIMGPEVYELESKLADYVGVKHAISCSSGTDALMMALMALRIGPGDAVITTSFSFFATAEVICLVGATPVFVDIDPRTYNIDPDCLESALKDLSVADETRSGNCGSGEINHLTPKAVIAVDLFGMPADYDRINRIAKKYGLDVIEDAAQSFGAEYRGKKAGSLADIACTSFYPAKPLGAYGDGGMCFTDDENLSNLLKSIRNHGMGAHRYDHIRLGINGRLDTLQAAILLSKLELLPDEIKQRNKIASFYNRELHAVSGIYPPKYQGRGDRSAWAQYSVLAENKKQRNRIRRALQEEGIPTAIYYPTSLNRYDIFRCSDSINAHCPNSESCAERIFSIPIHPYLTSLEQRRIIDAIRETRQ
ncbi:MAG: DegT/DnrJ/EryC1/StrS family aminotransferase [Desulfosarcina sp.]|nr:DegT/DnrJ/EryC1/StrS family aminotransferase [Desulfobacterales bacterium]